LDISELVSIHSIGHDLKDAKVEFNNDLKLNVSNISIEGKKGEILNIPRWVANILESEKHVEIKDSETLVELKQAVMKEELHGDFDLITLEPRFYIKIKSYMKRLSEKDYVKVESLLNKLLRTRKTKIIRLADSSKLTAEISQKLSVEEHEFYNQVHETSIKFSKKIVGDKK
jgi:DNA replication factor GINS